MLFAAESSIVISTFTRKRDNTHVVRWKMFVVDVYKNSLEI